MKEETESCVDKYKTMKKYAEVQLSEKMIPHAMYARSEWWSKKNYPNIILGWLLFL